MSLHFIPQHAVQFFGGGGSAPKAPKFKPVPTSGPDSIFSQADAQQKRQYDVSDAYFKATQPTLVAGRQANIDSAVANLQGKEDPQMAQALESAGLSRDLGSNEFQKARSLGQPILSLGQRDQGYFERMLGDNPRRTLFDTGQERGAVAAYNATNQYNSLAAAYGGGINAYNANISNNAANTNSLISAFGSLAGAGIKGYSYGSSGNPYSSNYLSNSQYGNPNPLSGFIGA